MRLDLQFDEFFDRPADVVWRAITDPVLLGRWLMENDFEPRVGHLGCELTFRHLGLSSKLECFEKCERGWDHFLKSLVSYVDGGEGAPFGARKGAR